MTALKKQLLRTKAKQNCCQTKPYPKIRNDSYIDLHKDHASC